MIITRNFTLLFLALIFAGLCGAVSPAGSFGQESKPALDTEKVKDNNPVYTVRDSVLSYFLPVNGTVMSIKKGQAKVNFSAGEELKKGMRFSVYRKGVPFSHPVTKEIVGSTEEFAGRIEIIKALAGSGIYLCRVVSGNPKAGDVVRITASKIKLAFFQDKKAEWTISEVFYNALKDSGRFEILDSYTTSYEPDRLSGIARGLGAEAVLIFSTPSDSGSRFLDVKLFWAEDAEMFGEFKEIFSAEIVREFTAEDEFISVNLSGTEPWGSYELVEGELIAEGDVDGDGKGELVVSDGNNIRIYRLSGEPQELWLIKGGVKEKHLSLDVLDLNDNGRAEIFVTSLIDEVRDTDIADSEIVRKAKDNRIGSFVLEYDSSGGYRKIWDRAPYIFRVLGKTLFMQNFRPSSAIAGPVYKGKWKDGNYQTDEPVVLPDGVNIYGFCFVDWQADGHSHVLAFDDYGYLNLYNTGELIWRSKESYGKFDNSFKVNRYSLVNQEEKWYVKGRLVPVKTERGQEVIVVKKEPLLSKVPGLGYKKSEVYALWWDGDLMNKTLVLEGIKGTVTDYLVERDNLFLIARPSLFLHLRKSLSGDFIKKSILYYYSLSGK